MEDIRTKAHLNNTQKIGLKHYDDFLDRMPREEAAAIEKVVMHLYLSQYQHVTSVCLVRFTQRCDISEKDSSSDPQKSGGKRLEVGKSLCQLSLAA